MKRLLLLLVMFASHWCCLLATAQQPAIPGIISHAADLINKGKADSAVALTDQAFLLATRQQDHKSRINALRIKGKAMFALKKNKEAVDLYFDALRLCTPPADDKEIGMLYREIGYSYYSQGHAKEAKQYYQKELAIRRRLYGNDSVGEQLLNLAVMHDNLLEKDSARMLLNEVNEILTRTNNVPLRGYYYNNLGALLQTAGKNDSSEICYHKAWDVWKSVGNENQIYKVTFNLGYLAEVRKQYKEAIRYYHLSEAAARKFGFGTEIAHVYGTMAEAYAADNDFKNAYTYLYQYAMLNDSLSKDEFNNYVVRLDKQFQTEKNQETIHLQQIRLDKASLEVQAQRNRVLVIVVILISFVFIAVAVLVYFTFRSRVKKQVDLAKSKFFANVVHEIRTPLSMIQGPVSILQSQITDPGLTYQLDMAARNVSRLNELINQMLDISKLDAARYVLTESAGSIRDFLSEVVAQHQTLAAAKNITLSFASDGLPPTALFDKDALEKIIGNLLGNAVKYTPSGGTAGIEVSAKSDAQHTSLIINIWDSGPGIAAADQEKIFSRFYRTPDQELAGTKGMGIGLSLVKDLVSLMHGTILLQSEPGKGAAFTVSLPLRLPPASVISQSSETGELILLVEDDADILGFNKRLLAGKGYQVITAANGDEAIALLKDQLPDLVITDLMMPGTDGLTLVRHIRSNPLTGHVPVIILSARTAPEAKMETVTQGAQVYLSKPFLPDELVALVASQLQLLHNQKSKYQQQAAQPGQTIEERFSGSDPFTKQVCQTIIQHLDDAQLSVEHLAGLMNINRSHFQRKIKTLTGYSPSELIRTIRLETAKELLHKKEMNITETAYATGFTSQSYFTRCYSEHFGYPPSEEYSRK